MLLEEITDNVILKKFNHLKGFTLLMSLMK